MIILMMTLFLWVGDAQTNANQTPDPILAQEQSNKTNAPHEPDTESTQLSPDSSSKQTAAQRLPNWFDKWNDPLIILNVFLFLAMCGQAIIFFMQFREMRKNLKQTRDLFELSERPSLGINFFLDILPGNHMSVDIEIKNSGKSPARNMIVRHEVTSVLSTEITTCPEPQRDTLGDPGSQFVLPVNGVIIRRSKITNGEKINDGDEIIFAWIRITYESVGGSPYFIEAYSQYDFQSKGFRYCPIYNDAN